MAVTGKGSYAGEPVAVANNGPDVDVDANAGEINDGQLPPMRNTGPNGVFTDGKLTLDIPADMSKQATIKLGDNTFPVSSYQITNNKMTGKFTSGDTNFDFEAVFDGNTVQFTSGNRKATLKKQGGSNPLDDM
jgi:hypothetical protein